MAEQGLIGSFLQAFTGLQDMDRQRKRDDTLAAQQAVDQELRRMEIKSRDDARQQLDQFRDQMISLRGENTDLRRSSAQERQAHNVAMETATGKRDAETERKNKAAQDDTRRREFTKQFYGPSGVTRREALGGSGYTDDEQQPLLQKEAARQNSALSMQAASPVPALAQALGSILGGSAGATPEMGGAKAPPKMLTPEDVANQQSQAFLQGSKMREAQLRRTNALTDQAATRTTQMVELSDKQAQLLQARLEKENAQKLINRDRHALLVQELKMNPEKFAFDNMIKQGHLDLGWANHQLAELSSARADIASQRSAKIDRDHLEKVYYQYKTDYQNIFEAAQKELGKVKALHEGAAQMKSQILLSKWNQADPETALTDERRHALEQAEVILAENSPQRIRELKDAVTRAERARNEATIAWEGARDLALFSTPMTERGTPAKPIQGRGTLPGIPGLGMQSGSDIPRTGGPVQRKAYDKNGNEVIFTLKNGKWVR